MRTSARFSTAATVSGNSRQPSTANQKLTPGAFMSDPLVSIRNLSLSLVGGAGPVNILRQINLTITAGETLSIAGPSGAGKTTLLMALSGLERPTSGSVAVAGTELGQLDEDGLARFRRRHVGI